MPWFFLIMAGIFEIGFTTCLKLSNNFTDLRWTAGFLICTILSFLFLGNAIQSIPLGTAYAVWTGIGALGTVIVGILFFKDPTNFWQLFFIFLLIGSIVGLKLVSTS